MKHETSPKGRTMRAACDPPRPFSLCALFDGLFGEFEKQAPPEVAALAFWEAGTRQLRQFSFASLRSSPSWTTLLEERRKAGEGRKRSYE